MNLAKSASLKSLFDSREGIHLTCYVENTGRLGDLRRQLAESMTVAKEFLDPVLSEEEVQKFLAPLRQLADNSQLLKNFRGNIGLFRTAEAFRALNVPVEVQNLCVVATSFHVKPLLRWIQNDREFLFLGLGDQSASLYLGSQTTLEHVDTILYPQSLISPPDDDSSYQGLKARRLQAARRDEALAWLSNWISNLTRSAKPELFLAGEDHLTKGLMTRLRYPRLCLSPIKRRFNRDLTPEIVAEIRGLLRKEARAALENAIVEFHWAEDKNLAKKNIFQIVKAALRGQVKKLIVAEDVYIFGKIDKSKGTLSLSPTALDHEDDDILDDIAQEVLAHGGEVIVAARDQIPKGRPALAILSTSTPVDCAEVAATGTIDEHRSPL